jgi:hypothetical protein
MKKPTPARAGREIDAKTKELMQAFFDHVRDYHKLHPGQHDPRKIFEAWAIQKIAALQYTVLKLGEEINKLAGQNQQN